jgi:hypothetical protein
MNLQELGLIHPEWDAEMSDDELARLSSADSILGTIHGLSPTLYSHLPRSTKVQLATQQDHINSLVTTLISRLDKANSAPAVDGGGFYNESTGRDIHLVCKSITRAESKLKIHMTRTQRHEAIKALFDFVVRHSNPTLVFHPKTLRTTSTLLDSLLHNELRDILNERSHKSFEKVGLVPKVGRPAISRLRLDWKPIYGFVRAMLNMDEDRRNPVHYRGTPPLAADFIMSLVRKCQFFFTSQEEAVDLFKTIFPLLAPGATDLSTSNPDLIDYQLRISKIEDATLLSYMLPTMLSSEDGREVDCYYTNLVDLLMELWNLVPDSIQWDRAIVTMLTDISKYNVIQWKPDYVRMIFACSLRELRLATAGTPLASPGHSNQPSQILGSSTFINNSPLGRLLGGLIAQILASSGQQAIGKSDSSASIFIHWLTQIESYLHPNNQGNGATYLKNILLGLVSELSDRFKAAVIAKDFERFMYDLKRSHPTPSRESQGYYDFLGLPTVYHGSLDNYIIQEPMWDAICPHFDRIRVHLVGSSLGRDLTFLLAHVRPSFINTSILPRIIFAFENPMLGRQHVQSSIETLTLLLPLLLTRPNMPTRIAELLDPLLYHIDPNDVNKSAFTFNFVLGLVLALNARKRRKTFSKQSSINSIQIPSNLASTIVLKTFNELKQKHTYQIPATTYSKISSAENVEEIDQEMLESELISLESMVSEWTIAFFERTLEFIDGVPSGTSSSASLIQSLMAVVEFVDDSIFDVLLRKLTHAVDSSHRAKTDLNPAIDAFARIRPLPTLHVCLDQWLSGVKKRAQAKSVSNLVESEVEAVAWKLDILRLICKRLGTPIGTHEKALLAIVEPLLKDSDKRIRKAALSVLPAALGPLKPDYNARIDSSSRNLKTFADLLLDQAEFTEPTKESLELAAKWTIRLISPIIQSISELTQLYQSHDGASSSIPIPKDFADQLRLLFEFITALGPILPLNGSPKEPIGSSNALTSSQQMHLESAAEFNEMIIEEEAAMKHKESLLGTTRLHVFTSQTLESSLPESLRTVRQHVISSIQAFINAAVLTGKCQEAKVVRRSFKVVIQALSHNGAKEMKWADKISRMTASTTDSSDSTGEKSKSKQKQESKALEKSGSKHGLTISYPARYTLSPLHPYYRQWRFNKSKTLLQARWSAARYKLAFGMAEIEAIRSFLTVAGLHPVLVRSAKLLVLMLGNVPRFSGSTSFMNNMLLKVIAEPLKPDQPLEAFTGFVGLLSAPFAIGNLASNWKNLNQFAQILRGLHIHDHALLQMGILQLFSMVIGRLNLMAATPFQDPGFFAAYTQLMDSSLADLTTTRPNTHWRYHLYTLIFICSLVRRNIHTPRSNPSNTDTSGSLFASTPPAHPGLNGLTVLKALVPILSDILPAARALARFTVRKLLAWAQEVDDGAHAEIVAPLLEEASIDTLLTHISNDRQQRRPAPLTLDPTVIRIVMDADPTEAIGDSEWGIGSELVQMGTFRSRTTDFWYRLFYSIRYLPNPDAAVASIAQYLSSKLEQNLLMKTSDTSKSSYMVTETNETATSSSSSSTASKTSGTTKSKSSTHTSPPHVLSSPSPEHVDEMEQYFFSLVEAVTGFTRAFPEQAQSVVWPVILSSPRISVNRMSSLIFSIAWLINYKVHINHLEHIILDPILAESDTSTSNDFGSLSVFEVESRLNLTLILYQESRLAKLEPLSKLVHHLFVKRRVASMPKPQIRSASQRLLALLSAVLTRTERQRAAYINAWNIHNEVLEILMEPIGVELQEMPINTAESVSSVATSATGSQVPVTSEDRIKSTFLSWVSECLSNRVEMVARPEWWTRVTKSVLELTVDSASATAKTASQVLTKLSQLIVVPISELEQVELVKQIENVKRLALGHQRWKARQWMLLFLRFFTFNHAILLPPSEHAEILDWSKHSLEDSNVDVRKAATSALSSLIRSLNPTEEVVSKLASHFLQMVAANNKRTNAKLRQDKDETPTTSSETIAALAAGVSGLVSIAASCPYSIPTWLPNVIICLQRLSSHNNGAIATLASEEISQFWKTHRDEWHFHKTNFTEEQLRILDDKPIPSYYA